MAIPTRKACDRCHDLKLRCRRINKGTCEKCLKTNQLCTSSPSLRYRKKRGWRGQWSGTMGKPLQILRPGPLKATRDILLPPQQDRPLCDLMSQLEQAPATLNPFPAPQIDKHILNLPSPWSSGLDSPILYHDQEAFGSQNINPLNHIDCDGRQKIPFAGGAELGYLELCLPYSGLDYNQFQDTICPGQVKQTLLEYLSEVNLAHDAWQVLERDTTCSGTSAGGCGLKMVDDTSCPSQPSIEELFCLSHRFSSAIHDMISTGIFASDRVDPAIPLLVYSRLEDIHNIILQLADKSLQLSKNAVARITT